MNDTTVVVVLPITHNPPTVPAGAVEILAAVKRHLGLDDERSWIVVAEGNEFDWPGYDLRKLGRRDRYDYGFLPPRFFNRVIEAFVAWQSCPQSKANLACVISARKWRDGRPASVARVSQRVARMRAR